VIGYRKETLEPHGMARILVIGLDIELFEALRLGLQETGRHECVRAASGAEGLRLARGAEPDLVVIAWSLPDATGAEICERLLAARDVPVIFVAEEADEESRVRGFLAGARDFVVAPLSLRELALRVRAILRRRVAAGGKEIAIGSLRIDRTSRRVWVADQEISLTRPEMDLLMALYDGGGACSRKELRRRAWGRDASMELHSVDAYVKRLRRKLGDAGAYIETVRNVGYRFATE
jgi:two-component system phosphate regulon response regulator PhoB